MGMNMLFVALAALLVGAFIGGLVVLRRRPAPDVVIAEKLRSAEARVQDLQEEVSKTLAEIQQERLRRSTAEQQLAGSLAKCERLPSLDAELQSLRQDVITLKQRESELVTTLSNERIATAEKLDLIRRAEEQLQNAFKALSGDALKSNNDAFLKLAQQTFGKFYEVAQNDLTNRHQNIEGMVKPVQDALERMGVVLQQVQRDRAAADAAIQEQVKGIFDVNSQLRDETRNLKDALRTPHVRGRWGEIQLRRVVEIAGMLPYCDFVEQPAGEENGRLRPDLKVNLPGKKIVVVDSKTPLTAYLDALESKNEAERDLKLRDHARQVRDHITKLASKSYWEQFEATPEFVVMFLPGESFFSTALQYDPSLIEYGVDQRVVPSSPTTLIALLKAIAYGWRQERIAENAEEISKLGKTLYERLCTMGDHFASIGKNLKESTEAYNRAVGSLEGRVFVTARRFRDLQVITTDEVAALQPIEVMPRQIEAAELSSKAAITVDDVTATATVEKEH